MIKRAYFLSLLLLASVPVNASISILGIELGAHSLNDVQSRLGSGNMVKSGDAAMSETSICYKTLAGEFIQFASNSEMAVDSLGVTAIRLSDNPFPNRVCPLVKIKSKSIFSNGFKLGMAKDEFEKVKSGDSFGCVEVPFAVNSAEYLRWRNAPGCFEKGQEPYYYVCSNSSATFHDNKVIWVEVTRIESVC